MYSFNKAVLVIVLSFMNMTRNNKVADTPFIFSHNSPLKLEPEHETEHK